LEELSTDWRIILIYKAACKGAESIDMAVHWGQWPALVKRIMNFGLHKLRVISCLAEETLSSTELFRSVELVSVQKRG
jgi:hypothetical protein